MEKYIAYVGTSRFTALSLEGDGFIVSIEAETEEGAEIIAMGIIEKKWPESAGWIRPARVSVARLSDFLLLRTYRRMSDE